MSLLDIRTASLLKPSLSYLSLFGLSRKRVNKLPQEDC